MRKPRKSTLDAFIDQFAEFPLEAQERALDLMQFEHRRAQIRAKKEKPADKSADKPADKSVDKSADKSEDPPADVSNGAPKLDLQEPAAAAPKLDLQEPA